jgi:hypothetical protein
LRGKARPGYACPGYASRGLALGRGRRAVAVDTIARRLRESTRRTRNRKADPVRCQQDTVYAAQATTDRGALVTLEEAQGLVDAWRDSWWWDKWLGDTVLRVEVGRGSGTGGGVGWYSAEARSGRMEFGAAKISMGLLVHELSHVLASARRRSQSHDPWFARIYLELTYLVRGSTAYEELRKAFDSYRVDYDAGGLA